MLKYISGAIIAVLLFVGGVIYGKYSSTQEFEIKYVEIEDTVWKDKYLKLKKKFNKSRITAKDKEKISLDDLNNLVWCYNNSLEYSHYTESDYLFVSVTDGCKSAEAKFKIGTKDNWTMYFTIGAVGLAAGAIGYSLLK